MGHIMAKLAFERLDVYRLSEKLADGIWDSVRGWESLARDTVGKQLIRAGDSIGANIAEGMGRGTAKDNCRFIQVARGSLYEAVHFLRRAFKRQLLTDAQIKQFQKIITELGPRLNAYLNSVRSRQRPPRSPRPDGKLLILPPQTL